MHIGLLRALVFGFFAVSLQAATDYAPVTSMLHQFIEHELTEKKINGIAVALIDDQQIVWSQGFGVARPQKSDDEEAAVQGAPMRPDTIIRAGSVSKLFTAILVMREVEAGRLDLDAPITKYLPNFHPTNRFSKAITLRHILSHRSGITREPPYGNYFEPDETSLQKMVESLNDTEIIYEPGERTKYSNAAMAMAGFIAAEQNHQKYPRLARKNILEPLKMDRSAFGLEKRAEMAAGEMWTLHGTKFPAPVFDWGMSPAASLSTTVIDLAKFGSAIFADAGGAEKLLRKGSLEQMWRPQFAGVGERRGFGLGFSMSELEGHRRAGHNGAVYGFATDVSLLPDDKLGAIVVVTKDFGNTVASRISTAALRAMLAARAGKSIEAPATNAPIPRVTQRQWIGKFVSGSKTVELAEFDRALHLVRERMPAALRMSGTNFVTDGLTGYGTIVQLGATTNEIRIGEDTYQRQPENRPAPPPTAWRELIGEYGWDYDVLYIFETDGQLWSLIEWFEFAPIEQVAPDLFRFPNSGSYAGEKLVFKRDKKGHVTEVVAGSVRFKRRKVGPEEGANQLRIHPLKPIPGLMKKALAEEPPREKGDFKKPELVELAPLDPTITLEIRYATTNNFLGSVFYSEPRAFLQRPAAEALLRVHAKLKEQGFGIRVFDAYRPWAVTKVFWDATTKAQHEFVADPSKGSRHNRGCAIDCTLYDLATGASVEMTGTYDETTDRSYPSYPGGTALQHWHREVLRRAMESEGFTVYHTEWWHFDYNNWRSYPILNLPFSEIK